MSGHWHIQLPQESKPAEEVVEVDLNRPETLHEALKGVYGVFLVTNFWEPGTDEHRQADAVIKAAKTAGVRHFIWSTLPNVELISKGRYHVPHYTGKAMVDQLVKEAGFEYHTFVIAPFFYQNIKGGAWGRNGGWGITISMVSKPKHI